MFSLKIKVFNTQNFTPLFLQSVHSTVYRLFTPYFHVVYWISVALIWFLSHLLLNPTFCNPVGNDAVIELSDLQKHDINEYLLKTDILLRDFRFKISNEYSHVIMRHEVLKTELEVLSKPVTSSNYNHIQTRFALLEKIFMNYNYYVAVLEDDKNTYLTKLSNDFEISNRFPIKNSFSLIFKFLDYSILNSGSWQFKNFKYTEIQFAAPWQLAINKEPHIITSNLYPRVHLEESTRTIELRRLLIGTRRIYEPLFCTKPFQLK